MPVRTVEDGLGLFKDLLDVNIPELGLTHADKFIKLTSPVPQPVSLQCSDFGTRQRYKRIKLFQGFQSPISVIFKIVFRTILVNQMCAVTLNKDTVKMEK